MLSCDKDMGYKSWVMSEKTSFAAHPKFIV
jgi:hypothetical protein